MKDHERFAERGIEILAVSRGDTEVQRRFAERLGAPFPLLSDADGQVAKRYGAVLPIFGLSRRIAFLIDEEGRIRGIMQGMPNHDRVFKLFERSKG